MGEGEKVLDCLRMKRFNSFCRGNCYREFSCQYKILMVALEGWKYHLRNFYFRWGIRSHAGMPQQLFFDKTLTVVRGHVGFTIYYEHFMQF